MVAKKKLKPYQREDELTMGEEILPNVFMLSEEETLRVLDYRAQDYLGMSGDEFLRRLKTNDFSDDDHNIVSMLEMMVPDAYK